MKSSPTYLALGDSYTIGEAVVPASNWPAQLACRLREEGVPLANPRMIATTGWTTDELSAAMDAAGLHAPAAPRYDFVTLSIGANNQYRGRDCDNFRREYAALLDRAIALTGNCPGRVLVLSIPDWGATPFGQQSGRDLTQVAAQLDAYNAAKRAHAEVRGVAFVDITPLSRERGAQPDMLAADGLHPSGAMYALWAERTLPIARALLQTGP